MPTSSSEDASPTMNRKEPKRKAADDALPHELIADSAASGLVGEKAVEKLKWLLANGGNPERLDLKAATPLSWACERNAVAAIKVLVEAGANIERADGIGLAPLMVSAMRGNAAALSLLLDLGADPLREQSGTRKGATALHYAAVKNQNECAKILVAAGASFEKEMNGGATPFQLAHQNGGEAVVSEFESHELRKVLGDPPAEARRGRSGRL